MRVYPPAEPKKAKNPQLRTKYYRSKKIRYTPSMLKRLHEKGLYNHFYYYRGAFQLGRYFRYCLQLDEKQAVAEIGRWIKRHYEEQATAHNLIPFSIASTSRMRKSYEQCVESATRNCLNGFRKGKPLNEWVRIYPLRASKYLSSFNYLNRQTTALLNLLNYAVYHSTLHLYLSYYNLLWIFDTTSRNSVKRWLDKFEAENILIRLNAEDREDRERMQYKLILPENCYEVMQ
jgi:hypothetical protein